MNNNKIDWAVVYTIVWILFCLALLMKGFDSIEGFGGLGAFLSGIFAPLALIWFYKSYIIQSTELRLQREELTLQREVLQQSVMAQEGSESSLKIQSDAIMRQLEIIESQYRDYLKVINSKQPLFNIIYQEFEQVKERTEAPSFFPNGGTKIVNKVVGLEYVIVLANSRADCNIKRILTSDELDTHIKKYTYIKLRINDEEKERRFYTSAEHITLICRLNFPLEKGIDERYKEVFNVFSGEKININYAFDSQYASDTYEFYIGENNQLKIRLLEDS